MVGDGSGRQFGDGKFDEKSRADRKIVFHVNGAAMFGNDARGNREAQTGAAILGGKVRQEKFVFVFRRDAVTGVGDADFDDLRVGMRAGGDEDFAAGANSPALPRRCRSD